MGATAAAGASRPGSIRTIWGIAKSPELRLDEDELYLLIARVTGKDSLRTLTQGEIDAVCAALRQMQGSARGVTQKRTDEGGNARTHGLRRKIYALTGVLGWNNNRARVDGLARRMFGVEAIEWLTAAQCNKLIEALKKMIERQEAERGENGT